MASVPVIITSLTSSVVFILTLLNTIISRSILLDQLSENIYLKGSNFNKINIYI